jgi:hypothetical protein
MTYGDSSIGSSKNDVLNTSSLIIMLSFAATAKRQNDTSLYNLKQQDYQMKKKLLAESCKFIYHFIVWLRLGANK